MSQSLNIDDKSFDPLKFHKAMRPCLNDMYSKCPTSYSNNIISNKCAGYQSVVLYES